VNKPSESLATQIVFHKYQVCNRIGVEAACSSIYRL
jgi:hypothetical protein